MGSTSSRFAPRLSFFFNAQIDLFEEIGKYRAARRIWARELRDTFGARKPESWRMRFHTQTAGVSLTAQQPLNNIVRTAIEALHQTPEQIVETAIQEDADAVGLSILSGAHMTLVPRVMELLAEQRCDVVVIVGGAIPREDAGELKALGVAEVFTPGASTMAIVDFLGEATTVATA